MDLFCFAVDLNRTVKEIDGVRIEEGVKTSLAS